MLRQVTMYPQVARNRRRAAALIGVFFLLVTATGLAFAYLLGSWSVGWLMVAVVLVVAIAATWTAYWSSDIVALRMTRARPADPVQYARLHHLVEGLCIASGLPKPRVYVVDDPAPNAFAAGRNPQRAVVVVTSGLLEKMNRVELEGVLAHELAHIRNYDILVATVAVTMVGLIALLADLGLRTYIFGGGRRSNSGDRAAPMIALLALALLILAPLSARLMRFAVARSRESLADLSAVEMTRYPPGLTSALEKLRDDHTVVAHSTRATAHLWIEEPMPHYEGASTRRHGWSHLFDTHPPIQQRIDVLRRM